VLAEAIGRLSVQRARQLVGVTGLRRSYCLRADFEYWTTMGNENTEYKCSACKKIIKSHVVSCKQCIRPYFHPGCMAKHRILDANKEIVTC